MSTRQQWLFAAAAEVMILTLMPGVPVFSGTSPVPDLYEQIASFGHKMDLADQELDRLDHDL